MKKLVFGLAAVVAATSFAAIESSNIVGYKTTDTKSGNQTGGVCFIPVQGSGVMKDITITGYKGEYLDNLISCGKLDGYGRSIARMFWVDAKEYDDGVEYWPAQFGWYSEDGSEEYNDEPLAPGEGLWMDMPSGFKVQSAGQVLADTLAISLVGGNQLISNPTPVDLMMGSIWIAGYEGEYLDNLISCGKLDAYGRSIARMFWVDAEEYDDGVEYWPAQYGWYTEDGSDDFNADVLAAGEGLWLDSPGGFTINFPSPLAK